MSPAMVAVLLEFAAGYGPEAIAKMGRLFHDNKVPAEVVAEARRILMADPDSTYFGAVTAPVPDKLEPAVATTTPKLDALLTAAEFVTEAARLTENHAVYQSIDGTQFFIVDKRLGPVVLPGDPIGWMLVR